MQGHIVKSNFEFLMSTLARKETIPHREARSGTRLGVNTPWVGLAAILHLKQTMNMYYTSTYRWQI